MASNKIVLAGLRNKVDALAKIVSDQKKVHVQLMRYANPEEAKRSNE